MEPDAPYSSELTTTKRSSNSEHTRVSMRRRRIDGDGQRLPLMRRERQPEEMLSRRARSFWVMLSRLRRTQTASAFSFTFLAGRLPATLALLCRNVATIGGQSGCGVVPRSVLLDEGPEMSANDHADVWESNQQVTRAVVTRRLELIDRLCVYFRSTVHQHLDPLLTKQAVRGLPLGLGSSSGSLLNGRCWSTANYDLIHSLSGNPPTPA